MHWLNTTWFLDFLLAATCSAILGGVTKLFIWLDAVKNNHLAHIQDATEEMARGIKEVREAVSVHDAHESEHHEQNIQLLTVIAGKH